MTLVAMIVAVSFALAGLFTSPVKAENAKPNIVFIMVDDLGPGWVDYDGSNPEINTPNLERLARSGMIFTRAYAAASVCSPTRAACITGMSPAQIGLTTHVPGRGGSEGRPGPKGGPRDADTLNHLPLNLPGYARGLKKQGYATGFIGTGPWYVNVTRAGRYVITLRQKPGHVAFPLVARTARLTIAGIDETKPVTKGATGITFDVTLPAEPTTLTTYLADEKGAVGGAHFTDVEFIGKDK